MQKIALCGLLSLITFQISSQAAVTLVSNIVNEFSEDVIFSPEPVYQSFQVGSANATILSVTLNFGFVQNPEGVQVSLFSDNSSAPGSSLGAFSLSGSPASIPFNSPIFTGSFDVTANTKYWIEVSKTTGGLSYMPYTLDFSETGLAGWSIGNSVSWDNGFISSGSIQMTVSGVPEPSAVSLVALGIGGLAALSRVRRKADKV